MNRGLRTFTITFAIGILLFGGGYFLSRPTWRTATEAEIRAQLNPELLTPRTEMPDARDRYNRLVALLDRIERESLISLTPREANTAFLTRAASPLKALDALLSEGPIQAPVKTSPRPENERLTVLVRELSQSAAMEFREGHPDSGVWALLLAIRTHKRLEENSGTMSDFLSGAARVNFLVTGVEQVLFELPEDVLAKLAAELPPAAKEDPALLNALRDEVRISYVPHLADPVGKGQWDGPDDLRLRGNYDALETARDLNQALSPWQLNAKRPRSEQDLSGDAHLRALEKSLPFRNRSGKNELALRFAEWRFSWQMARLRNSFGRRLLVGATNGAFQAFADTSYRKRACWEGLRATIALRRYRLAKGVSAPSLQAVVDEGFLPKLPFDHLGTGPLKYDPARSVLWSIGTDGQDDGGTVPPGVMGQNDIVWRTP